MEAITRKSPAREMFKSLHQVEVSEILIRNGRDGNIKDVHFILTNEVEQKVQRSLKDFQLDFVFHEDSFLHALRGFPYFSFTIEDFILFGVHLVVELGLQEGIQNLSVQRAGLESHLLQVLSCHRDFCSSQPQ